MRAFIDFVMTALGPKSGGRHEEERDRGAHQHELEFPALYLRSRRERRLRPPDPDGHDRHEHVDHQAQGYEARREPQHQEPGPDAFQERDHPGSDHRRRHSELCEEPAEASGPLQLLPSVGPEG